MSSRAVATGLALAVFLVGTGGDLPHSPYSDIAVATAWISGVLAYGWSFGRTALWLLPVLLTVTALLASWLLFEPDPRIGGMDQIGEDPGSTILALPLVVVVLGLAVVVRSRRRTKALATR